MKAYSLLLRIHQNKLDQFVAQIEYLKTQLENNQQEMEKMIDIAKKEFESHRLSPVMSNLESYMESINEKRENYLLKIEEINNAITLAKDSAQKEFELSKQYEQLINKQKEMLKNEITRIENVETDSQNMIRYATQGHRKP